MEQGQEAVNPYANKSREELINLSQQVEKTKEENLTMKDQNILLLSHVDKLVEKNTHDADRPSILADKERRSTLSMPEDQVSELLQNILIKSNTMIPETPANTPTKLPLYRTSEFN